MKGNHTKKVKHINNKTLIVTLDIGKNSSLWLHENSLWGRSKVVSLL